MTSRSGSCTGDGAQSDGVRLATSKRMPRQSGKHAAGDPAAASSVAAVSESDFGALCRDGVGSADSEEISEVKPQGSKKNPWNDFQHAHKNRGLTSQILSRMYQDEKLKRP